MGMLPEGSPRGPRKELLRKLRTSYFAWPIIAITAFATVMSVCAFTHTLKSPDMTIRLEGRDPESYNRYAQRKHKLYEKEPFDYANYQHPRPRFD